jgi:phosphoglycerate dehydrogenase-like enzyme
VADADALVTVRYAAGDPPAPRLRLLQSASSGTDRLDAGRMPAGCVMCNARGHEEAVAEYILWAVLDWSVEMRSPPAFFAAGEWSVDDWNTAPLHREAQRRTLGVIGFGQIGREAAKRARAIGMRVTALSTWRGGMPGSGVDHAFTLPEKTAFLRECDFIAVCLPLTERTRGMIGWEWFVDMRRDAVVIQVGRGPVVDEESFYRAHESRSIRGATIDVWYDYPKSAGNRIPASRFAFHALPNTVVTPHVAARSAEAWDRRFRQIADNLNALAESRPLANLVATVEELSA